MIKDDNMETTLSEKVNAEKNKQRTKAELKTQRMNNRIRFSYILCFLLK